MEDFQGYSKKHKFIIDMILETACKYALLLRLLSTLVGVSALLVILGGTTFGRLLLSLALAVVGASLWQHQWKLLRRVADEVLRLYTE